jgi:hypothetical protein
LVSPGDSRDLAGWNILQSVAYAGADQELGEAQSRDSLASLQAILGEGVVGVDSGTEKQGNTALHIAAAVGRQEMVTMLLKHDADTEVCNHQGKRPIDLVDVARNPRVRDLLEGFTTLVMYRDGIHLTELDIMPSEATLQRVLAACAECSGVPAAQIAIKQRQGYFGFVTADAHLGEILSQAGSRSTLGFDVFVVNA